ncbi:MAG: VWA domain-containing protein, partial [Armatimonadetes bacterium]|nr:VWA domain-containing protein [Armatimonadota bacterium]
MCASAAVLIAASIFFRAHSCIVVPPPPPPVRPQPEYLDVRSQHVTISFEHPVVRTRVETTLYNPHDHAVEGTFLFPIPANASVTKFQFFVDGRAVSGEILPAEKARDAYLEIVRGLRDPALLEYSDMGLFRARLFPVEPHKTSKIAVECLQTLAVSDNLVRYFHNIRLGRTDTPQTGELIIDGRIHSQVPVKSVFSPTHDLEIVRQDDHNVRFSLELNERPYDRDFLLYYGVADAPVGFHSLVHRSAGEDGYFLLLLAPAIPAQEQIPAKDVVLVIDTSGSMRGDKINQARRALLYALKTLKPGDRFGIIAFATAPRPLDDELLPATAENVERASKWIEELEAAGGTDIHGALIEACKIASIGRNDGRPSYILMATDGQPTYGVRDTGKIVSEVTEANRGQGSARSRLFVLGIGYDVNAHLLDLLA